MKAVINNCLFLYNQVDPFLGISDDHQVYAKIHVDVKEYGTVADNQLAMSTLSELRNKICKYHQTIKDVLVHNLANITEVLHFFRDHTFFITTYLPLPTLSLSGFPVSIS